MIAANRIVSDGPQSHSSGSVRMNSIQVFIDIDLSTPRALVQRRFERFPLRGGIRREPYIIHMPAERDVSVLASFRSHNVRNAAILILQMPRVVSLAHSLMPHSKKRSVYRTGRAAKARGQES